MNCWLVDNPCTSKQVMSESLYSNLPNVRVACSNLPKKSDPMSLIDVLSERTACLPYVQLRMMYLLTNKCVLAL